MKQIVLALSYLLFAGAAVAQPSGGQQPARDPVATANQGTVGVITGMEGGTYARTGADLTILDDDTLRVLPTLGKGSLQNLSDILFLKGVDIGFVQSDALPYARQHGLLGNNAQNIRYIAKLYDEEVHVLARKDITQLSDLEGQRVNVDVTGSGSAMTAEILLNSLGIKAKIEHEKQITGVQELKRGDIAAIIHVGGAPIPLLAGISSDDGVHFLPVPLSPSLGQIYLPDQLSHDSYPSLVPADASVETIAVGDVMAVFAWQPRSERYNKVARFVDAFFSKFDQFQQPPRHPKWREVNLTAEVPGWTRFQPAEDWLIRRTAAGTAGEATQSRFNAFLAETKPGMSAVLTDEAKEALFRQFLTWGQATPGSALTMWIIRANEPRPATATPPLARRPLWSRSSAAARAWLVALCATSTLAGLPDLARADTEPSTTVTEIEADHRIESLLQQIEQQLSVGHTLAPERDNALTTWSQVLELLPPSSPGANKALASFAEHTRRNGDSKQAAGDPIAASDYFVFSDQATKLLGVTSAEGASAPKPPGDGGADPALAEAMANESAAPAQEANRDASPVPPAAANDPPATATQADHSAQPPEPAQRQTEVVPAQQQAGVRTTDGDHAGAAEPAKQPSDSVTEATQTDPAGPPQDSGQQQAAAASTDAQADHAAPPAEPVQQQATAAPTDSQANHAAPQAEPVQQQATAAPTDAPPDHAAPQAEPVQQQTAAAPTDAPAERGPPSIARKPQPDQAGPARMQVARGDTGTASGDLSAPEAGAGRSANAGMLRNTPVPSMTPALPPRERQSERDSAATAGLVSRGDAMVALKDVSAARKLYQYAANAGSARAATALGETYDPAFLSQLGAVGLKPDVAAAASWYRKAAALGDRAADRHLQALALGPAK